MRISSDPADRSYSNHLMHPKVKVYLDGIERSGVITADEERRTVVMVARDQKGNLIVDGNDLRRESLLGTVHVEVID
jgi:hypothetical protein